MSGAAAIFVAVAAIVGAASLFLRVSYLRAAAFCVLLLGLGAIWLGSLGHARPAPLFPGAGMPGGTVIAFRLAEPVAIYVWLAQPGEAEPLALRLPWSEADAAALMKAAQTAKALHGEVKMASGRPGAAGNGAGRGQRLFYPASPSPLPPKAAR